MISDYTCSNHEVEELYDAEGDRTGETSECPHCRQRGWEDGITEFTWTYLRRLQQPPRRIPLPARHPLGTHQGEHMRASQIAETLINGNISDARNAIVKHRTQTEAAIITLDVLEDLLPWEPDHDTCVNEIARLRRCLNGGT